MMRLAVSSRGVNGITLVSDAIAAAGHGKGEYLMGNQMITVDHNGAHLADGTLAGSAILLDDAVRNAVRFGVCTLAEAVQMASLTPARILGISERKGQIAPGYEADLVVLDADLQVKLTIVGGQIAYHRIDNESILKH